MAIVGKEPLRVLYDEACGLCRRLAEYGRGRSEGHLLFIPWQEFAQSEEAAHYFSPEERGAPPTRLRTLQGDDVRADAEAWAAILNAYPPFEHFSWIVERLGIMGAVSQATYYGSHWLRSRCGDCP